MLLAKDAADKLEHLAISSGCSAPLPAPFQPGSWRLRVIGGAGPVGSAEAAVTARGGSQGGWDG